jgi:RNA polymerase sigma-70 factor (ECF subfamily)
MLDKQIKTELKKGNPSAFREVFRILYPRLSGYCRLFISIPQLTEDIIQDTFITLWDKRNTLDPEQSIESLMFVMVRNRCLNELKKVRLGNHTLDLGNISTTQLQFLYQLDFSDKEEKSLEEMLIESLKLAIDELPEKMKEAFVKAKIEGRKQSEVAEELGVSVKMVEKHIASAKEKIKEKLLKQYPLLSILILLLLE